MVAARVPHPDDAVLRPDGSWAERLSVAVPYRGPLSRNCATTVLQLCWAPRQHVLWMSGTAPLLPALNPTANWSKTCQCRWERWLKLGSAVLHFLAHGPARLPIQKLFTDRDEKTLPKSLPRAKHWARALNPKPTMPCKSPVSSCSGWQQCPPCHRGHGKQTV